MSVLVFVPFVLAFVCWLVALVSWVLAVANRRPDVSWARLVLSGIAAFDPELFTEVGRRHQRRFLLAFGGFFLCAIAGAATVALAR